MVALQQLFGCWVCIVCVRVCVCVCPFCMSVSVCPSLIFSRAEPAYLPACLAPTFFSLPLSSSVHTHLSRLHCLDKWYGMIFSHPPAHHYPRTYLPRPSIHVHHIIFHSHQQICLPKRPGSLWLTSHLVNSGLTYLALHTNNYLNLVISSFTIYRSFPSFIIRLFVRDFCYFLILFFFSSSLSFLLFDHVGLGSDWVEFPYTSGSDLPASQYSSPNISSFAYFDTS